MLPTFNTDVGKALYYAKLSSDKEALSEYVTRSQLELSSDAVGVLNASLKSKIKIEKGTRRINMCKAWDDALAESREEGKAEGKAEGRAEGRAEGMAEAKAENEKEIANRVITYMRPLNTEEQIYDYLCKVIGISDNHARAYLAARH